MSDSCDPMDCVLPGSSVHGILQARILEWLAISFSRGSSWARDGTWVSCTAGRLFTDWAMMEAQFNIWPLLFLLQDWSYGSDQHTWEEKKMEKKLFLESISHWFKIFNKWHTNVQVPFYLFLFICSCCTTCRILVPQPGIEPWPTVVKLPIPNPLYWQGISSGSSLNWWNKNKRL